MKNLLVCTLLFAYAFTLNAQVANTRIYAAEKLAKVKEKADSPLYAPAVKTLLRDADKALKMTPPSVMDKTMTADSGDKHDYMSMGPYWWPDPSKPDGLPYIRKTDKEIRNWISSTATNWEICRKQSPHWDLPITSPVMRNMRKKP